MAGKKKNTKKKSGGGKKKATAGSWAGVGVGVGLSMVLLAVAAALGLRYFQERPQDLTQHSEVLLEQTLRALDTLFIPAENIDVSDPELQELGRTRWNHYEVEILAPPQVRVEGLSALLARELLPYGIGAEILEESPTRAAMTLLFSDYAFATISIRGPAQTTPQVRDIREEAYNLAGLVQEALEGAPELALSVESQGATEASDAQFRWATSRIDVRFAHEGAPALLAERIREAILGVESTGATIFREREGVVIRVFLFSKTVVEIRAAAPPALEPLDPPAEPDEDPVTGPPLDPLDGDLGVMAEDAPPPLQPRATQEDANLPGVTPMPPPLEELPLNAPSEGEIPLPQDLEEEETEAEEPAALRLPPRAISPTGRARVAIIMDDGGYGGAHTETVLGMSPKLTLAILPNTPFGSSTAERGLALGFEIMLHMPMETGNGSTTFPREIQTGMDRATIHLLTREAIAQIPGLTGVNNHTGSKFTANAEKMAEFLEVVRDEGLFFIDSVTRGDTVAWRVAHEMGIPTTRRDIFIDHDMTEPMIRMRFEEMIAIAKARGSAIGIAHFRPLTVTVLEKLLPLLDAEDVELVHASELLQ